jgi:fructokinase
MASEEVMNEKQPIIVGTGLIALDVIVDADAPSNMRILTGGTCGNVLSIMSYLGWASYPVARLNGDEASKQVRNDLARWGVNLDFANLSPHGNTPIIVQKLKSRASGRSSHSFSWSCPTCGADLPRFKPVVRSSAKTVISEIEQPSVFFTDRCSPASLMLAREYSRKGALVVFEPSSLGDLDVFEEIVSVSHVLKYSADRLGTISEFNLKTRPYLQIETLGERGLRYRTGSGSVSWRELSSLPIANIVDTCGAGDWMTAGLIHKIGATGSCGLLDATPKDVEDALEIGQAMAGWNCHFVGARGGMYVQDTSVMRQSVTKIINRSFDFDLVSEPKIPVAKSMVGLCGNCANTPQTTSL